MKELHQGGDGLDLTPSEISAKVIDRLSFQKFGPLDARETVPDETMIRRFRQRLIESNLHEELLGSFNI